MSTLRKRIRDRIYCYLPLPGYYGRDFKRIYAFLQESRHWTREKIQAYKLERIQALLTHAQKHVPYYRDLFKTISLDSRDVKNLDDFAKIPILTRSVVRDDLESLKADNIGSYQPLRTQTSGTTGAMTAVYRSRYHESFRKAQLWRFYNEYGHFFRDRWVNIACRSFDPASPVCEYNRVENCLLINTYHIIRGCHDEIIEAIRDFRPNLVWTHPSPLGILAEYAIAQGLEPIKAPLVVTFAEKLFPHVRKAVTQAFPGRYIEYFGNRENSFAAWGNSDDKFYEVSEYCHMEVDRRGPDGITGDLITTGLHNYAVPLIRYDPGDLVRWHGYQDNVIPYPVIELLGGRGKDVLVTRDGLTVPYFLTYIDSKNFNKLKKYQIEQINLDEVILRVVPRNNYVRERDESLLIKYASESFANKLKIRLEYVEDIPLTDRGKYRAVISPLAVEYFERKQGY